MSKSNNIVPYSGTNSKRYNGTVPECEWKACIDKLRSQWSRLMLSNEDVETVLKIAAKLP